tara:strand:- start:1100 stop:4678 length:3579 start_codon:yes stop_codon:yes gene_type:complete
MATLYNNPGNIRPGQKYAGETGEFYYDATKQPYVIFDTPEMGLRALFVDLRSKIKEFNGDITQILNKYAPPSDGNPTNNYINFVRQSVGKNVVTNEDLPAMVKAFIEFENKPDIAQRYLKPELIDTAYKLSEFNLPQKTKLQDALKVLTPETLTASDVKKDVGEITEITPPTIVEGFESQEEFGQMVVDRTDEWTGINFENPAIKTSKIYSDNFEPTSFAEGLGARYKLSFLHKINRWMNAPNFDAVEGYNSSNEPELQKGGEFYGNTRFMGLDSPNQFRYLKKAYREEAIAHQKIQNIRNPIASVVGFTGELIQDPLSYVPLIGWWSKAGSASQRFARASSASLAATVPYEYLQHESSPTRTLGESAITMGTFFLLSGAVASLANKGLSMSVPYTNKGFTYKPGLKPEKEPRPKSLGAAAITSYRDLELEELRPTGTGLEKWGLNPLLRIFKSKDGQAMDMASDLVSLGGMIQKKVDEQIPMKQSVETNYKRNFVSKLGKAINGSDSAYLKYRGIVPEENTLFGNSVKLAKQSIKDFMTDKKMRIEFNRRVGLALMRNEDRFDDLMSPFVTESANHYRSLLNHVKDEAQSVKLFSNEVDKKIKKLKKDLEAKLSEWKALRKRDLTEENRISAEFESKIKNLEDYKKKIETHGVQVSNSKGYYPRVYNINYLRSREGNNHWMRVVGNEIGLEPASRALKRIILDNSDAYSVNQFDNFLDKVSTRSAIGRTLDVDDELLIPFLEWNVEAVIRDHVRRMGTDIELTRTFGSVDLEDFLGQISNLEARKDIRALRDILRGTYAKPDDPFSWTSQSIATVKRWALLTQLGNVVTTSMTDLGRTVMTEGINNFVGSGLRVFMSEQRKTIFKMNRQMLREAGEGWENVLAIRAAAFADAGSDFGRMGTVEKVAQRMEGPFFFANGLNWWNSAMKEWASITISQRMYKSISKDWQKLNISDRERLLATGIDGPMQGRMQLEFQKHSINQDGFVFPNLSSWTDETAAMTYLNALSEQVSRTIVTPGAGDLALWTRTHTGSMIAQFKSFGQASTQRVLISGLQQRDQFFWQGAILMTTLGMIVNEIKREQYGITTDRTWGQVLWEGVERAGLPAILSDFNHVSETLTGNRISMDALMGGNPQNYGARRYLGEFGGPAGSIAYDLYNITEKGLSGNIGDSFFNSLRRITPYQNHPAAIPLGQ